MSTGGAKIRVLIVDDIPETRENLRKLLYFENDIEVVAAASNGQEGIEFAKEYQPDIVLMDINMPGVDGISASEAIAREAPTAQVIMMSVQSEADYLRRSMLAGARDFLTKPFSGDELVSTIRRVYEMGESRRRAMPMMQPTPTVPTATAAGAQPEGKIITLFSPKGGSGCSFLAVNLSIALHRASKKSVVLVDASLQFGDVAVALNLQPTHSIADLAAQIEDLDDAMVESALTAHSGGIKALLAPPRPEMADLITSDHLERILNHLKRRYEYVVVDTWTSLHDTVLTALDVADQIILVATPDIPTLRNVRLFFEVADQLGYPPDKVAMVLNKSDPRRSRIRAADIQESLKHSIMAEIPADEVVVLASINQGVPLVISDSSRPVSQAVTRLANKLLETWAAQEEQAATEAPAEDETRRRLGRFFR